MATLKELTDAAGIEHVVWVDDLFDDVAYTGNIAADIELRELAARLVERKATVTIADKTLGPDHTTDEWMGELNDLQESGTDVAEIRALLNHALGAGDAAGPADYSDAAKNAIIASFGAGMVTTVGSQRWPDLRPTLPEDRRTLLIVDREFAVQGVTTSMGEQILQNLLKTPVPKFHVVMLTRSIEQDAEALRTELAKKLEIPRHEFEVTAKAVTDDVAAAEASLCSSFQRIFTHHVCISLTHSIYGAMRDNLKSAVEQLASQSVYDLDRVVFQNSLPEGASELDVLTRILLLRQRVAVDTALVAGAEYFEQLGKMRALRQLAGPLKKEGHSMSPLLTDWRHDEVCDPDSRLNPAYAPLSCGDVFVRLESTDYFILLGQPCDLAVRNGGERKTHEAIFVAIESWEPEKDPQNKRRAVALDHHFFRIPAAPLTGNGPWRLDFRQWASVNLRLLDFAVFSGNGAVRLNVTAQPAPFLLPGWKKLLERAKRKLAAAPAGTVAPDYAKLSLSARLTQTAASKVGDEVTLNYRRVGRLRAPWAVAAYSAFASYQARAAFDHDFADDPVSGAH